MKKRTLSLLLAVACALSLSGCGGAPAPDAQTSAPAGSETPAAVDQTREIVFAASRDQCPGEQDAYYASMSLGVWEPLITKDESGKPAPALATEWERNEDSTVWTFHLREGVTFSNGTPFNADSVLANFDRMKKGPFESSFYGMNIDTIYPGLVSYEKTDDYTVVLTLSEGQPLLDYTMVNYGSAIFEPSCFAEDGTFAGFPIGTGPYVVTENVLGQYCVIERNDNYWGTPGIAKTFRFKVIPDAETRYTALRAGEVQGLCDLGAISPSQAAEIDGDPAYNVSVGDSGITHFLNVNGGAFPFNDVRMREGLSLLLSVPGFWLALFLITVFAEWLHLLPTSGLDRGLASLVLPAVALSAANVGSTSRFTRGNILAQLGEQYIVVANAKGLSQRAVMVGHAFRNSLVPIITLIGNYFGGILGGSTIIENIFAIPGLGSYVLSAIQNRDYPVIQGYVLITGTTFVLVTLAIDLLYIAVNPKIRLQGGEA